MRLAFWAVVVAAFAVLLLRAARVELAGDYLDPVAKISAPDEALCFHNAIRTTRQGHWLMPRFMGRDSPYNPPLAVWFAAASAKVFGVSRLALRWPGVLIAALALGLVFRFGAEMRAWQCGAFVVALLLCDRLWMAPASMLLTDGLLAAFEIGAMYCLFADPWLESRAAFWGFAGAFAGAVMTKGIGAAPLAVSFVLYCVCARPNWRPAVRRALAAMSLAALLAAPWYVYQAIAHTRWLFTEHFGLEILTVGVGALPQTTAEGLIAFYSKRLVWTDPLLFALFLTAVPAWFGAVKKRAAEAILLACWFVPMLTAVLAWHYPSITYLIPSLAPMALAAVIYAPVPARSARVTAAVLVAAFAVKLATPATPWGLSFAAGTTQPAAAPLSDYCRMGRGNELIVVDAVGDLYASTLPLPNLRYAIVSGSMAPGQLPLDYPLMGVTTSADDFNAFDRAAPRVRSVLGDWGLDQDEPLARLIVAATPDKLMEMTREHPLVDLFLPSRYRRAAETAGGAGHDLIDVSPRYFLLLSRQRLERQEPPAWSCEM